MVKRTLFEMVSGILLICLGFAVMLGWYFHVVTIISMIPGQINMVFNTALCFMLSGLALVLSQYKPKYQNKINLFFGMLLFIISGLTLLQYIFNQSFGVDHFFVVAWLFDGNLFPGRMAINTSVTFLLTSLCFLLFPFSNKQSIALLLQVVIFSILLLSVSALLGHILHLEFLYRWYQYTRMAIHTSIGMTLLSVALSVAWSHTKNYSNLYKENEDRKIIILSAMILISITAIACLAGYTVASDYDENQVVLIFMTLGIAISTGILLLDWQVMPLVQRLVKTKKQATANNTKLQAIFNHVGEGIITTNHEGIIESFNPAAAKMFGYKPEEVYGKRIEMLVPYNLQEKYRSNVSHYLKIHGFSVEGQHHFIIPGLRKDKMQFLMELSVTGMLIDDQHKYVGIVHDVSERKAAEDELSFKAYYDTLTGLINRNQLEHSLDLSISSALRSQQRFAVFFIDLDHFKNINDTLGHDAGDELLKIIGDRLRNNIRKTDIAARLGGDEFILVLNGTDNPDTAAIFAEKILNTILKPIVINEHQLYITASIGISFYPSDGLDYQSLIKSADIALYIAKDKGRNNYQFCTPEMNEEIQEKAMYKKALQLAVQNKELYLTYLPRINTNNQITGFEVLLRWKDEKYGDVSPTKIIPLAEEIGIINQLGDWIVRTAAEQTILWKKAYEFPLKATINISTRHYLQQDFVDTILHVLNEINFPPDNLELEINESLIMQDPEYSIKVIHRLKHQGIKIIIDNFGTGYSSLNFLNQFKVDYIKISREFIKNIVTNFQHHELVTAMIALSKNLNIKVIAEGVESEEQYLLLLQMGCDQFQGYYISHPLVAEKVPQLLAEYEIKTESI